MVLSADISFVGRLTSNGDRTLYFYTGNTLLYDKYISDVFSSYPNYQFDYGAQQDSSWSIYFDFLFPQPIQFQSIMNRRVVNNLKSNGDKLTKRRKVYHWINFQTEEDVFWQKIESDNYLLEEQGTAVSSESNYKYSLKISRVDKVDYDSVDEYVLYLWEMANKYNGEYDGWDT